MLAIGKISLQLIIAYSTVLYIVKVTRDVCLILYNTHAL